MNKKEDAKENKKKTCFIIMPITTPPDMDNIYSGGNDHFTHVLNEIFIPAIKDANLEPIRPIAKGADIIKARIINQKIRRDVMTLPRKVLRFGPSLYEASCAPPPNLLFFLFPFFFPL